MIVTIGNWKGGSGKTTTAMYLAQAVGSSGASVDLIDADPQGSASIWSKHLQPTNTRILTTRARDLVDSASRSDADVVIVDLPPADQPLAQAMFEHSAAVVVPTRTSGIEVSRVVVTMAAIPDEIPSGLVITAARPHIRTHQQFLDGYAAKGWPVWGVIPERIEIAAGESWNPDGIRAASWLWNNITGAVK